ncbi:MAG: selenide, water dikinase SelD [Chitinophagaceae bacterium]|jgi:selenide,water dikinase|nr:selenide, water dikinase SelD [Chitinophagaceae bacterium]
MEATDIKITGLSKASGCGCKLQPDLLARVLEGFTTGAGHPGLLVGNDRADDASVMQLTADLALVQTVDFFTPLVNDAMGFGKIAAANAISDVYAMGGTPLMANAILGYPVDMLAAATIRDIMEGARQTCAEAGIPLAGGHSINIGELVFGLSVTGKVHPTNLKTNAGAKPGDLLYLTKPLGTGILGAALKRGKATEAEEADLIAVCSRLNNAGSYLAQIKGVNAMTDVTGFGFYGHLLEMCNGAGLQATVAFEKLPLLAAAKPYAAQFILPDNAFRNWNHVKDRVETTVKEAFAFLNDPQTNGGLLVAVAPEATDLVETTLVEHGLAAFAKPIGFFTEASNAGIVVR